MNKRKIKNISKKLFCFKDFNNDRGKIIYEKGKSYEVSHSVIYENNRYCVYLKKSFWGFGLDGIKLLNDTHPHFTYGKHLIIEKYLINERLFRKINS
jgi:hypothetical protein